MFNCSEVQRILCILVACLIQREHVEVADVVLLSVSDPGSTLLLVDHLAHVLAHKRTLKEQRADTQIQHVQI